MAIETVYCEPCRGTGVEMDSDGKLACNGQFACQTCHGRRWVLRIQEYGGRRWNYITLPDFLEKLNGEPMMRPILKRIATDEGGRRE